MKPWDKKKKEIAVIACNDALPEVEAIAQIDLVIVILAASGGSKIEILAKNGTRSVDVNKTKSSHGYTLGKATDPLSISNAQKNLKRIFIKGNP